MAEDRAVEALAALLQGNAAESRRVLRGLSVTNRAAVTDGCHLLLAEIGRVNLEEVAEALVLRERPRVD